jgi:hypothetical protein
MASTSPLKVNRPLNINVSVCVLTELRADNLGTLVRFLARGRNVFLLHSAQTVSGTHTPRIQWARGALSVSLKLPEREAKDP